LEVTTSTSISDVVGLCGPSAAEPDATGEGVAVDVTEDVVPVSDAGGLLPGEAEPVTEALAEPDTGLVVGPSGLNPDMFVRIEVVAGLNAMLDVIVADPEASDDDEMEAFFPKS
jgi:hypothetical protein